MTDEFELYGAPGHLIRRLQQIAVALFMAETRRFDITPVQYAALFSIRAKPGLDQTALANVIAIDRSTIANVVERLEAKKLITRKAGASDRRTKRLYVTPAGRKLLAGAIPAVQLAQGMILAPLKPGERGAFMSMLRRMVDLNNSHSRAPLRVNGGEPVGKEP
ncbi:MAG TPA: MarR family winged helix-turn-helix transcriptional regulator [Stellaceae bacterium]|jgi:DNA-binding MarR family transcriptional regulator|nr:MarR family winged helix-turn-helix transcriptional regulator [Stellaceae bacterium]